MAGMPGRPTRALALGPLAALAILAGCGLGSGPPASSDRPAAAPTPPAPPEEGSQPEAKDTREESATPDASDDAAAEDVFVGAQAGVARPYIPFGNRPERPTVIEATEEATLVEVSWREWGSPRASGTGTARVNTCEPSCAEGRVERRSGARIELSGLRAGKCRGEEGRFYTRARVRWPAGLDLPESESVRLFGRCT
jgi:hypothetical protein